MAQPARGPQLVHRGLLPSLRGPRPPAHKHSLHHIEPCTARPGPVDARSVVRRGVAQRAVAWRGVAQRENRPGRAARFDRAREEDWSRVQSPQGTLLFLNKTPLVMSLANGMDVAEEPPTGGSRGSSSSGRPTVRKWCRRRQRLAKRAAPWRALLITGRRGPINLARAPSPFAAGVSI